MQVFNDLTTLEIPESDILEYSEETLKQKVKKQINNAAYAFLMNAANKHSKVRSEIYKDLDGMAYFDDARFTPDLSNLLFKFRTRMFNVRNNFRNHYKTNLLCPLCSEEEDSQEHLLKCKIIVEELNWNEYRYQDVFSEDPDVLLNIAKVLKRAIKIREDKEDKITN